VPEQRADSLAVAAAKLTGQVTELLAVVGTLKERLTEVEEDQGGTNRRSSATSPRPTSCARCWCSTSP